MKFAIIILALFLVIAPAYPQYSVSIKAGTISYAEGQAFLNQTLITENKNHIQEIAKGSILQTGSGKAEVQLGVSGALWMGNLGILQMEDTNLNNIQLRIDRGSMFIEIIEQIEDHTITLHAGNAEIQLSEIGIYRLDSDASQLRVYSGKAEIHLKNKKILATPGKLVNFADRLKTSRFSDKQSDSFNYWTAQRSQLLYGKIKEARKEAFMKKQLYDLQQQRITEDSARSNAKHTIQEIQAEEASRQWEMQKKPVLPENYPYPADPP